VAAGEDGRDEVLDDILVPHDPAPDLIDERAPRHGQLLQQLEIALVVNRSGSGLCCHASIRLEEVPQHNPCCTSG
jgi:hypothetical protein